jgi:hypothetical protein
VNDDDKRENLRVTKCEIFNISSHSPAQTTAIEVILRMLSQYCVSLNVAVVIWKTCTTISTKSVYHKSALGDQNMSVIYR